MAAEKLTLAVDAERRVSALLDAPPGAFACYVLAHGAGAGMTHPAMATVATELAERGIATLRYQFPYMEQGSKRPDPPALCHATVRAAVAEAGKRLPKLPLIAGGSSFGGRMTSQAQAKSPLPGVRGLAFLGFPLHPAGKPSDERAVHLSDVTDPDAVPAGHARCARRPVAAAPGGGAAGQARHAAPCSRTPTIPSMCRPQHRAQGCRCAARDAGRARGLDRRRWSVAASCQPALPAC